MTTRIFQLILGDYRENEQRDALAAVNDMHEHRPVSDVACSHLRIPLLWAV